MPAGPRIGPARVRVADVGGEEFDVAPGGLFAGVGDQRRHEMGVGRGRELAGLEGAGAATLRHHGVNVNAGARFQAVLVGRLDIQARQRRHNDVRRVGAETPDIFFELLVAAGMCGGKDFGRHQIGSDALNVPAAAGAKRQTKAAGVGMKFDQPLDGAECHQDREGLIELLDDIKRFAGQRVMADKFQSAAISERHGVAGEIPQPVGRARGAGDQLRMHAFGVGDRPDDRSAVIHDPSRKDSAGDEMPLLIEMVFWLGRELNRAKLLA